MNLFINATATKTGGALTILYEVIDIMIKKNINIYVFTSVPKKLYKYKYNITIVNCQNINKINKRIFWDMYGLKRWSKKNGIYADIVLSLQNTGFRYFKNARKLVYVHQSIPYYDYKWSFFKKDERVLWFYKKIYKKAMELTWDKKTELIVQTNWMKKLISSNVNIEKINVIKPELKLDKIKINKNVLLNNKFIIFYPANSQKYKMHIDIIKAVYKLEKIDKELFENLEIIFTIDKSDGDKLGLNISKYNNVMSKVKYLGYLSMDSIVYYYEISNLIVFPSTIETIGLPILEAKLFNKAILVKKAIYSCESLGNYRNSYIYNSVDELSKQIEYLYKNNKFNRNSEFIFKYDDWSSII